MCGIAGYYSSGSLFHESDLHSMTEALAHRGPDSEGYFKDHHCGLGFKRLSIIDLSASGNQPMTSGNGRYKMIYNGEVYNYQDLANELRLTASIDFKSNSDSEVVLEAFSLLGTGFLEKLNGMFAIAIYDTEKKELYLFRDRLGIKPLFYYRDGGSIAFASELKSFKKVKRIPQVINQQAIRTFLNIGYIPSPATIYQDIHSLEPGSYLKISESTLEQTFYWKSSSKLMAEPIQDEKEALIKTSDLLTSSVQLQMRSDVPFGVFLSGGIDSSLIAAQAVNLSGQKLNTFSVGFTESSHNEATYSKTIAAFLRTDHHEFFVSQQEALDLIDPFFETYDQPFADSSGIPTMIISRLAKRYVTVCLSGEGADELFWGYGFYKWARRLEVAPVKFLRKPISGALSVMPSRYRRVSHLFDLDDYSNLSSHIFSQEQYFFSEKELNQLLSIPANNDFDDYYGYTSGLNPNNGRQLDATERQALFDLHYYLCDDLLTKVDRASMHYSLETRVPYLDHRLVELALNISPSLKLRMGTSKYLLKEILYKYIPKKYFNRPKRGFSIPLASWLKKDLKFLIDNYLSEEVIRKHNLVNYEITERLKVQFFSGADYLYNRLWALIVLHKWMEKNTQTSS